MSPFKDAYTEHQLKRWMRPDAHRFIRPDWRRFVKSGSEIEAHYERYERKYSPDQPRDDHGQWTNEIGGAGDKPSPSSTETEPTPSRGQSDPRSLSDTPPDNYYKPGAQVAANESTNSSRTDYGVTSQTGNTDEPRISRRLAQDCELLARLDRFACQSVRTRSCWAQAAFRYSQCLIGGYIPPIYH